MLQPVVPCASLPLAAAAATSETAVARPREAQHAHALQARSVRSRCKAARRMPVAARRGRPRSPMPPPPGERAIRSARLGFDHAGLTQASSTSSGPPSASPHAALEPDSLLRTRGDCGLVRSGGAVPAAQMRRGYLGLGAADGDTRDGRRCSHATLSACNAVMTWHGWVGVRLMMGRVEGGGAI